MGPGFGRIDLAERGEEGRPCLLADSDPRVADLEEELVASGLAMALNGHRHFAVIGEFDRVAGEIGEHLLEPEVIGDKTFRKGFTDRGREVEVLGIRVRLVDEEDLANQLLQLERPRFQLHLLRVELRVIEDVVEDVEE